jgi:hypothetical protein
MVEAVLDRQAAQVVVGLVQLAALAEAVWAAAALVVVGGQG